MGISVSLEKVSSLDIKYIQQERMNEFYIITTLKQTSLHAIPLIAGTLEPNDEERIINDLIKNKEFDKGIVIYGANSCDVKVIEKYKQILKLGFTNVFVYIGGLFEWLLLVEAYPNIFHVKTRDGNPQWNVWDYSPEPNSLVKRS